MDRVARDDECTLGCESQGGRPAMAVSRTGYQGDLAFQAHHVPPFGRMASETDLTPP